MENRFLTKLKLEEESPSFDAIKKCFVTLRAMKLTVFSYVFYTSVATVDSKSATSFFIRHTSAFSA